MVNYTHINEIKNKIENNNSNKFKVKNKIKKKYNARIICITIAIFSFCILNGYILYAKAKNEYITNTFFRIHVVANSNSLEDQILKEKIAKVANREVTNIIQKIDNKDINKENIKKEITQNVSQILNACNDKISELGYNYEAYANIGNIYYSPKEDISKNITMTDGIYDSIQIIIGSGEGKNWWSLIYPFTYEENIEITNKEDTMPYVSTQEIVSSEKIIKFKFLQIFEKLFTSKTMD